MINFLFPLEQKTGMAEASRNRSGQSFTLRTVEDTLKIREFVEKNSQSRRSLPEADILAWSFAENLRELGLDVTIVQRPKQLMNPLDGDMAAFVHAKMRSRGVKLMLGHTVEGFEKGEKGTRVLLKDEQPLEADMVILAIGVAPDSHLAKEAGLELGIKGSIVVNDRMETSAPDIFAAGDAVEVKHYITGGKSSDLPCRSGK